MLQQIRDTLKSHKWLTYTVLGALALIFASWGAYGVATMSFGSDNYVAKVDGHTIPYEDVRSAWQRQQSQWQQRFGGDIPASQKALLQDQLLESVVRNTLLTDRANKLGYRVTPAQLSSAIRSEQAFQLDGQYNADVAKSRLAQAGVTQDQYAAELQNDLERRQLAEGMQLSQFITPAEVDRLHALTGQERQIRYAVLPLDKYMAAVQVSDAQVQTYYDGHKAQFMTPESVHLQYAQLTLAQVTAQVTLTDDDVRAYYEKNKTRYISTEQRHVRHILVATSDKVDAAAALKKAQDIDAKLKAGGNFEALAKQYSDDAGSAAQGGDLGPADRANLESVDKAFADAVFAMKAGEVSAPVRTKSGYDLIRVDEIVPVKGKTFDEAKADVTDQLRHDKAADRFGDTQEQLQQKVDQAGGTLESLAKQFGLTLGDIPEFTRGAGGGELGTTRELQELVFGDAVLGEHKIGGPLVVGDDKLVLVKDLSHSMPAAKPLASVRDQIVALLRSESARKAVLAAAEGAVKDLQAGKDFETVAKGLGVTADAARFIGRDDPSVPAAIREDAFKAPKPTAHPVYQSVAQSDGGAAVLGVLAVRVDTAPVDKQQVSNLMRDLAAQYGEDDTNAYIQTARKAAKVQKNIALFDQ